jgi:chromate reductase
MKKIIGLAGSLRKDSFNKWLLRAVAEALPEDNTLEILDIGQLPLFNQDLEVNFPAAATELKNKIKAADAVVICTPEYNRSIPGVLKNAIDWCSRPYGDNAFDGKPVLVLSASIGLISAALAHYDLKKVLLYLNCRLLGQPEFFLPNAKEKFDASGKLIDSTTKEKVKTTFETFFDFLQK